MVICSLILFVSKILVINDINWFTVKALYSLVLAQTMHWILLYICLVCAEIGAHHT